MSPEDLRAVFGRRVRDLRKQLGLSHEELAERADLHRNYIGGIERGERNVGILKIGKLASALELTVAELFGPFTQRHRRRRS